MKQEPITSFGDEIFRINSRIWSSQQQKQKNEEISEEFSTVSVRENERNQVASKFRPTES
jgi:hypothetical protein